MMMILRSWSEWRREEYAVLEQLFARRLLIGNASDLTSLRICMSAVVGL
jgi:hypothetical protein